MKKIAIFTLILIICPLVYSQQIEGSKESTTKFSDFTARAGQIMSFEDFNKTTFSSLYGTLSAKKRIVKRGVEQKVFIILELPTKYSSRTAAIAEDDLQDLFNAVATLQNDAKIDASTNSEYMEKFYVTEDHFKIGYYVSNKQVKWYVDLDTRLSESTFFIKDIDDFYTKLKALAI